MMDDAISRDPKEKERHVARHFGGGRQSEKQSRLSRVFLSRLLSAEFVERRQMRCWGARARRRPKSGPHSAPKQKSQAPS